MVRSQIAARGVSSELVLAAMREVPRHEFVPARLRDHAYEDRPLPIGFSQTISQPYIVAAMTELAELREGSRVLEIGTGSGYQAAVIHEIVGEVYSIEIIEELAQLAEQTLRQLGYDSAHLRHGDGYRGWPEEAPFDAILVTAAPPEVPRALLEQLAVGGHLVVPVGEFFQQLERHTRTPEGIEKEVIFGVRFVPMVHGK
jgi:protein-L-isoaspartate(D-aspartate) O-methyltransferase